MYVNDKPFIGKIGIVNKRKPNIPWEVIDEKGYVRNNQDSVLNKWKKRFSNAFISDEITETDSCNQDTFNGEIDVTNLKVGITREEAKAASAHVKKRP